jgi:hypothetical protein
VSALLDAADRTLEAAGAMRAATGELLTAIERFVGEVRSLASCPGCGELSGRLCAGCHAEAVAALEDCEGELVAPEVVDALPARDLVEIAQQLDEQAA